MDGGMVHNDHGLLRARVTQGIQTGDHHAGVRQRRDQSQKQGMANGGAQASQALATIVVGLGLYFYLSYFQFQLPVGMHANWERLPILILAALLGYFAARTLNAALFDFVLRLRRHYEAPTLVRNIFTLLAFTILFVITFRFVYPTYDLGALFTTSAIFGVIIG